MNDSAYFDRFTVNLPNEATEDCSAQGDVSEACEYWADKIEIEATPGDIRSELKEWGAWEDDELTDDDKNKARIIWISACNIKEERYSNDA